VFHKGQELYGLFEARLGLRQKGYALVVEGYMDVVALAQAGFPNAVATLGTACTADHMAKLFRFTESVVFSFDGDAAGRRAAARALEAALPHASDTRSIRFLFLPTEHDPDSYVRELGADAFDAAVAQAVPLSTQLVAHAGADCDLATPEGRSKMLTQAGPLVELLPDGLLREQLVADLAQRGGMAVDVLQAHWSKRAAGRQRAAPRDTPRDAPAAHSLREADAIDPRDGAPPEGPRKAWRNRDGQGDGQGGGHWSGKSGGKWGDKGGGGRFFAMAGIRTPPQTATLLDRLAWLLARHAGAWLDLPGDVHEFLAGQPSPHGPFFAALERTLHDHGAIALPSLLDELRSCPDADTLAPLLHRMAAYHAVDDDEAPAVLVDGVLRRLKQRAVADELEWLIESGELSDEATARRRELIDLTRTLKAPIAAS